MESSSVINPLRPLPTDMLVSRGNGLEEKIRVAQSATGEKQKGELKNVSQQFEAIFLAQMLKVMRETIEESGLFEGGFGKSIYTELFDQEIALNMAGRGALGISDLLYGNLSAQIPESGPSPETDQPLENKSTVKPARPADAGEADEISDLQLPVQAPVSSAFGMRRDPFSHQAKFHKGLDLAAPEGMKVVSALSGTVVSAGYKNGYGNTVLVQHADGVQTRYGHLGSIKVRAGDVVPAEAELGTVGSTGRSTGPHLHFEVIRMGTPVDPLQGLTSVRRGYGHPKMGG